MWANPGPVLIQSLFGIIHAKKALVIVVPVSCSRDLARDGALRRLTVLSLRLSRMDVCTTLSERARASNTRVSSSVRPHASAILRLSSGGIWSNLYFPPIRYSSASPLLS